MLLIDQPEQVDLFPHVHWKDEETEQPQGQSMLDQQEKTEVWQIQSDWICYDLEGGSIHVQGASLILLNEIYFQYYTIVTSLFDREWGDYTGGRGWKKYFLSIKQHFPMLHTKNK